ncbi:MAG: ATP-binding protein [Acidiferrobacter sp.]
MSTHSVKTVIHTNKAMDENAARSLSTSLRDISGVVDVRFHANRNHLLIVGYDSGTVSAQTLLKTVIQSGYSAQLIGL